jgi:hypothetical protein
VPIHVYRRTVERAIQTLGDEQRLAHYLRVPPGKLHAWRTGGEMPPLGIFLSCVELILDDERGSATQLYLRR